MLLRKDDPWIETLPIPDIRNWRVVDGREVVVGFVETVAVDREDDSFEAMYTGPNSRFPADALEIGDHVVRVLRPLEANTEPSTSTESRHARFDHAFFEHFNLHYGDDYDFDRLLLAYQFGRETAGDADFAGRSFANAEEDLRARYGLSGLRTSFEEARPAIRFGYELARGTRRDADSDMSREEKQIVDSLSTRPASAIERSEYLSTTAANGDAKA